MKISPLPSLEYLEECFEIDISCPSGLRWKTRPRHHFKNDESHKRNIPTGGKPAGCKEKKNFRVMLDFEHYGAHRIIYALYHKTTDLGEGLVVDHINRNPHDNRPENLRLITSSQNQKNKRRRETTSNFPYVNFSKSRNKWRVVLRIEGKTTSFGSFSNIEDAKKVAREVSIKYDGEFSPFLSGVFTE